MALHLYGAVGAETSLPDDLLGRGGEPVRRIADERLAVLVTEVDDDRPVGRADLLAHAHVLEKVAESDTVVPIRFGMTMPDEDTVRAELLGPRGDHSAMLLQAFEGAVQLTVTTRYDEEQALREIVRRDPGLRAGAGGADVPARMRLGEAVAAALEVMRADDADRVLQRLAPHARAVAFNEVRDVYTVSSLALLVDRALRHALDVAVSDLRDEIGERLRVRYVGPQPPYAFLDSVDTGEKAWA
jgi:hypothetical protein